MRRFFNQLNKDKMTVVELGYSEKESITGQFIRRFVEFGRISDLDLKGIDSEGFDKLSSVYGGWLLSKAYLEETEAILNENERDIAELERSRSSVEALIHEGPDYPKYVTAISLCLSLIPGSNLIWTGYVLTGLFGAIVGGLVGFGIYFSLEQFYKNLIHRDLIKTWDLDGNNKHEVLIRKLLIYLRFLFFVSLDGVFTWAVIMFRLQASFAPEIGMLDYSIFFASIITDVMLICFLYQTVSPNLWTLVRDYCRKQKDLSKPGQERSSELSLLKELEKKKKKIEKDLKEWGRIKTYYYRIVENLLDELFGETPIRIPAQKYLDNEPIEIIFPNISSRMQPYFKSRYSSKKGKKIQERSNGHSQEQDEINYDGFNDGFFNPRKNPR